MRFLFSLEIGNFVDLRQNLLYLEFFYSRINKPLETFSKVLRIQNFLKLKGNEGFDGFYLEVLIFMN